VNFLNIDKILFTSSFAYFFSELKIIVVDRTSWKIIKTVTTEDYYYPLYADEKNSLFYGYIIDVPPNLNPLIFAKYRIAVFNFEGKKQRPDIYGLLITPHYCEVSDNNCIVNVGDHGEPTYMTCICDGRLHSVNFNTTSGLSTSVISSPIKSDRILNSIILANLI